jgi:hypothetical protein
MNLGRGIVLDEHARRKMHDRRSSEAQVQADVDP